MNNKIKKALKKAGSGLFKIGMIGLAAYVLNSELKAETYKGVVNAAPDGTSAQGCSVYVAVKPPRPNGWTKGYIDNEQGQFIVGLPSPMLPLRPGDSLDTRVWNEDGYGVNNVFPITSVDEHYQNYSVFLDDPQDSNRTYAVNIPIEKLFWVPGGPMRGKVFMDDNPADSLIVEIPEDAGIQFTNGLFGSFEEFVSEAQHGDHYTLEVTMPDSLPGYSAITHGTVNRNQLKDAMLLPKLYFPGTNPNVEEQKPIKNLEDKFYFQSVCKNSCKTDYNGLVELYNSAGEKVGKRFVQHGNLNLVSLPAGVYHAKTPEGTHKIVKTE